VIRRVTHGDAGRVVELLQQLWPGKGIQHHDMKKVLDEYMAGPGYWIYGYEAEKVLWGIVTVSFRWTPFHEGEVAIIEDLVIDEAHRGKDVGQSLVRFAEEKIFEHRKAKAVEVNSDVHRVNTHGSWEKCGYSRLAFQFRKEVR